MNGAEHAPWLRIIDESGEEQLRCGHLEVVPAAAERPPFPVAATIVEEDTWLVLSASPAVREPGEHPLRLLTDLLRALPAPPGSVVVREGEPLRLLAVIHDLDREPSCRPEWIVQALGAACREAAARGLTSLALPLLGSIHSVLSAPQSAAILATALAAAPHGGLRRIWLVVPERERQRVLGALLAGQVS